MGPGHSFWADVIHYVEYSSYIEISDSLNGKSKESSDEEKWKIQLKKKFKFTSTQITKFQENYYEDPTLWPDMTNADLKECDVRGGLLKRWRKVYPDPEQAPKPKSSSPKKKQ